MKITHCLLFVLCSTIAGQGGATTYDDPTWPCVQRKVDKLSVGLMWPHPIDDSGLAEDAQMQADIAALADLLSLRRIPLTEAEPHIAQFAQTYSGDMTALGLVFQRVFSGLSQRRDQIIQGIGEFSLGQIALAKAIDGKRARMDQMLAAAAPDYDVIDKTEEQIDWDQTIYADRQKSITYLCETPQLLEKRLYEIAQMLQHAGNP